MHDVDDVSLGMGAECGEESGDVGFVGWVAVGGAPEVA